MHSYVCLEKIVGDWGLVKCAGRRAVGIAGGWAIDPVVGYTAGGWLSGVSRGGLRWGLRGRLHDGLSVGSAGRCFLKEWIIVVEAAFKPDPPIKDKEYLAMLHDRRRKLDEWFVRKAGEIEDGVAELPKIE